MTDLDCKQTEKLIPQFLKDELDNRTEKKFLNHVDGCSSCLEELEHTVSGDNRDAAPGKRRYVRFKQRAAHAD